MISRRALKKSSEALLPVPPVHVATHPIPDSCCSLCMQTCVCSSNNCAPKLCQQCPVQTGQLLMVNVISIPHTHTMLTLSLAYP